MPESGRIRCPRCWAVMERQGEMVDCAAGLAEPWAVDPDLGLVLLEVHRCPTCGRVVTRRRVPALPAASAAPRAMGPAPTCSAAWEQRVHRAPCRAAAFRHL